MEKNKSIEKEILADIQAGQFIVGLGKVMLADIKKTSTIEYVTDAATKKIDYSLNTPRYVAVPEEYHSKCWVAQDEEKNRLDSFRGKVAQFRKLEYFSKSTLKEMDNLIKDIITYSIQKGYQGTASEFLRYYANGATVATDKGKDEFIMNAVKGIIGGYAKRTLLTGEWYGDRAAVTIYEAQHGDFGTMAQTLSEKELIETFNTTPAKIEDIENITIEKLCSKHKDLPYRPLTKEMCDKEAARIDKQRANRNLR